MMQESGHGHQGKGPAAGDGAGNVRTDGPTLPRDLKSNQIDAMAHGPLLDDIESV